MKRLVLICILALTNTLVFAQTAKTSTSSVTVNNASTAEFLAKVKAFDAAGDNKPVLDQNFEDLKHIMTLDLNSLKPKIVNAANDTEKAKWTAIMKKKQDIYFSIISAASDMRGNAKLMVKKYKEYAATL